jgi:transposase
MNTTMIWAGLDVHARSTEAAAIDVLTGELTRARFGVGSEAVVEWLLGLRSPARVVYEAGPTGFALYRAAQAAGIAIEVIAPSKTARPAGDRVKNDRKDAELLARLAMAGQLSVVVVPDEFTEAARHLSRTREQVRGDLMSARHRVSKLLLAHGRVYDGKTTWNRQHRLWLGRQRFEQAPAELAFIDLLAAVDGLIARKEVLDERLSRLASDERLGRRSLVCERSVESTRSPRLRCTSSSAVTGGGSPRRASCSHGLGSPRRSISLDSPRPRDRSPRRAQPMRAGSWLRLPGTTFASQRSVSHWPTARAVSQSRSCRSPGARSTVCTAFISVCVSEASRTTS